MIYLFPRKIYAQSSCILFIIRCVSHGPCKACQAGSPSKRCQCAQSCSAYTEEEGISSLCLYYFTLFIVPLFAFNSLSWCFQKEKQSKAPKKGSIKGKSQQRQRSLPVQKFKRIKSNLHIVRHSPPKYGNQDCTCSEQDPCSHEVCFFSSFDILID